MDPQTIRPPAVVLTELLFETLKGNAQLPQELASELLVGLAKSTTMGEELVHR